MAIYCVNRQEQANGDHEVHKQGCHVWPAPQNALDLGEHPDCHSAVRAAKKHYSQVNGCVHCARPCHTQ